MEENRPASAFRRYRYGGCLAGCGVLLAAVLAFSLRLAYAGILEQEGGLAALARAAALDPWNASYHAALADLLERHGLNPEPELALACRLDPHHAGHWIRRAIRAEMRGEIAAAERSYLEAARVDHQFAPRTALMNFYFRQGDAPNFWIWARRSFERSYGDRAAAFQLCWMTTPDPAAILERALPPDAETLRQFLVFAADRAGPRQAMPVGRALLDLRDIESRNALLNYCDRLRQAGLLDDAKTIWDGMARRGLVPANEPGNLLTNPLFRTLPSGRGFDWRLFPTPEVALTPADPELGFSVDFSGDQPEACPLIRQIVPVPEESLSFGVEYRTSSAADNGLRVAVEDAVAGEAAKPLLEAGIEPSLYWTVLRLPVPRAKSRFVCVAVRYRRKPGTVRYSGRVEFRRLRLSGNSSGR
jgi:hypothetical protein